MEDTKEIKTSKGPLVHYGKLLDANIKEQGRTKEYVMGILGYKAYDTLNDRIADAKFSYDELRVLCEKGLL